MKTPAIDWGTAPHLVDYSAAVDFMERRVAAISAGTAPELIWLVEHPEVYTAGTSAKPGDLIDADRFPVHITGRGGQYTYHGPGQRVVYVMVDVRRRFDGDVRRFVGVLEGIVIQTLARFGVAGEVRCGRVGVWVARPDLGPGREDKIAALGIRIRRGVSFHGLALNVDPNLSHFDGIVPCGISEHGVTSLRDLGLSSSMAEADAALKETCSRELGGLRDVGVLAADTAQTAHASGS
jgi:lipoyl(octanoyl) transferase